MPTNCFLNASGMLQVVLILETSHVASSSSNRLNQVRCKSLGKVTDDTLDQLQVTSMLEV